MSIFVIFPTYIASALELQIFSVLKLIVTMTPFFSMKKEKTKVKLKNKKKIKRKPNVKQH